MALQPTFVQHSQHAPLAFAASAAALWMGQNASDSIAVFIVLSDLGVLTQRQRWIFVALLGCPPTPARVASHAPFARTGRSIQTFVDWLKVVWLRAVLQDRALHP